MGVGVTQLHGQFLVALQDRGPQRIAESYLGTTGEAFPLDREMTVRSNLYGLGREAADHRGSVAQLVFSPLVAAAVAYPEQGVEEFLKLVRRLLRKEPAERRQGRDPVGVQLLRLGLAGEEAAPHRDVDEQPE